MFKPTGQQVRFASGKRRTTVTRSLLHKFLGPKNFKGLYKKNPLAFTPSYGRYDASKNYITNYKALTEKLPDKKLNIHEFFDGDKRVSNGSLKPFPFNPYCVTNRAIPTVLKNAIVKEHEEGHSFQRISFKYGISLPRIEAVVKLREIENLWESENRISTSLQRMSRLMAQMFPEIGLDHSKKPVETVDNLTEIPTLTQTRHQRFLTIAESEPFGPVDASKVLSIEPATELLRKLSTEDVEEEPKDEPKVKRNGHIFFGPVLEGEKTRFRFTTAQVGKVGHRYAASRDDQQHTRKIKFTAEGRMMYA